MIFTAGVVGWDEQSISPTTRSPASSRQALRNTLAILAEDGAGPEHIVRMTCYVTDRTNICAAATRSARLEARSWARTIRRWRWSRSGAWSSRGAGRDRDDGGGAGMSYDSLRPRPPAPAGPAAGIPLRPARAAISRAAQRRGRTARRAAQPDDLAVVNDARPLDLCRARRFLAAASRGCWSRRRAWSPATACCCAGPTATPCSPPGSACSKAGGVVVTTMPLLRPGEIATVIERAADQPRHRRQPLHRRLPRGDRADALRQAPRQI